MIRAVSILLPIALLGACNQSAPSANSVDSLDAELLRGNAGDPAVTAALQDQIMVDPSLTGQSGNGALKPADKPYSAAAPASDVASGSAARSESLESAPKPGACPSCKGGRAALTLGELASVQKAANRQCAAKVGYSAAWANRLPAAFALHPDARLSEAAGTDADGCRMRVVSFTIAQPVDRMVDWYYTRSRKGGYSAEHQAEGDQHVLGGTRGNAAYAVFLSPEGRGTSVDLIVDGG